MTDFRDHLGLVEAFKNRELPRILKKHCRDLRFDHKDDLYQELCLRYCDSILDYDRLKVRCKLSTYIFQSLRYAVSSFLRGLGSYRERQLDPYEEQVSSVKDYVDISYRGLSKYQRQILFLRYRKQWSIKQVADFFDVSGQAIKKQIRRAKIILRENNEGIHMRGKAG